MMTEAEARELLQSMTAWDSAPALTSAQVDLLLDSARRVDSNGLGPDDTGWTDTYDLNAAAAEGWRWKAGAAAGKFGFSTDGQSFNRQEITRACREMATLYRNRVVGSIPLVLADTWDTDVIGNVNT